MPKKLLIVILIITVLINGKIFNHVLAEENPPVQEENIYLEVMQDDVRVRTGPSTSYDILQINGENQYYLEDVLYKVIGKETNDKNELWYNVINIINGVEYYTWIRYDFVLLHYYELDNDLKHIWKMKVSQKNIENI